MSGGADWVPDGVFIGGMWRVPTGGARFAVDDPATGAVLATMADASVEDGIAAVAAAHAALSTACWRIPSASPS